MVCTVACRLWIFPHCFFMPLLLTIFSELLAQCWLPCLCYSGVCFLFCHTCIYLAIKYWESRVWTIHSLSGTIKLLYCLKRIVFLWESFCNIEPCPEIASLLAPKQCSGQPVHSPALEEVIWCCDLPFQSALHSKWEEGLYMYIVVLCACFHNRKKH